jgi:hypothetical protein
MGSTTSLQLCFHSWLCDVTSSFFTQLCCSYSLSKFYLFYTPFILIIIYIYIDWGMKATEREIEHLRTLGVYRSMCYANTGLTPNNVHIFTVSGHLFSLSDKDDASFETLVHRYETRHAANTLRMHPRMAAADTQSLTFGHVGTSNSKPIKE